MSLSTLRPETTSTNPSITVSALSSLASLTDDSLLVVLSFLRVPTLLPLLTLSRRFYRLMVHYTFPRYRSILFVNSGKDNWYRIETQSGHQFAKVYFSKRFHSYVDYFQIVGFHIESRLENLSTEYLLKPKFFANCRQLPVSLIELSSFPASLPLLMPHLASLAFSFCLAADEPTKPQLAINSLLRGYLNSSWSSTLVSLHLSIIVRTLPHGGTSLLLRLNHLSALRHLFLDFQNLDECTLLPDSMPVLAQLNSFSLHDYRAANTATLLHQLGIELSYLSLKNVSCSDDDFVAFLKSKPTYRETLKTLEMPPSFARNLDTETWTLLLQSCPSLERLYGFFAFILEGQFGENAPSFFKNLREMGTLRLLIWSLRRWRDFYPRDALPKYSSLRTVSLHIPFYPDERENFSPSELFDDFLPLLASIFCAVENVLIVFSVFPYENRIYCPTQSELLAIKTKEHFRRLTQCIAKYYV